MRGDYVERRRKNEEAEKKRMYVSIFDHFVGWQDCSNFGMGDVTVSPEDTNTLTVNRNYTGSPHSYEALRPNGQPLVDRAVLRGNEFDGAKYFADDEEGLTIR